MYDGTRRDIPASAIIRHGRWNHPLTPTHALMPAVVLPMVVDDIDAYFTVQSGVGQS